MLTLISAYSRYLIRQLMESASDRRSAITVLIAAYKPKPQELSAVIDRVLKAKQSIQGIEVKIIHNDPSSLESQEIRSMYQSAAEQGLRIQATQALSNLGFGGGINKLASTCDSALFLILNQDAIPEPGAIEHVVKIAKESPLDVVVWEMRQIPYEHPKIYDPASMETPWASGAALLVRASAFKAVGGFEPRIFMYGEDVDLSWKIRARGWKIHYVAKAAVVHETYEEPTKSKPLQVIGAIYAGLALRTRYSGRKQVLQAFSMALAELYLPRQEFRGRRRAILAAILRFFRDYAYYRRTAPLERSAEFEPFYAGWSYEERRIGAFYRFKAVKEQGDRFPLVSVLIRTCGRSGMLRQALQSIVNQTWPSIEVVVVEDGPGDAKRICDEFNHVIAIRFQQNILKRGRSEAGNTALALATGEWLCFLDDDDQLFADHCEVLVQSCLENNLKGAYGLAWRVFTDVKDANAGIYHEVFRDVFPNQPFNRLTIWERNLFPIQAVLFHRSLYERYGGLDTEMDQLEDWNLWTRYTLHDDFKLIEKVTSLYRVPSQADVSLSRQLALDEAYASALEKQGELDITLKVHELRAMVEEATNQNVSVQTISRVKQMIRNNPIVLTLYRRIQVCLRPH